MSRIMKKFIYIVILSVMTAMTSCAQKEEVIENVTQATERGQSDAQALLDISTDNVRELHSALLSVKAREWEMRREGKDPSADAYIKAFKEYLAGNNKALADEIF